MSAARGARSSSTARKVEEIIDFLEIQHIRKTPVGRLPYGLQKRVELARALAAEPTLLLLDEPMAGMNVEEKQDMCRFILDVNEQFGTTIVLIEHDMGVVMDISDRVVVLDYGKKIGDGTPDEVRAQPGGDRRLPRRRALSARRGHSSSTMPFFFEVLIGGLLSGVMYSLVALGFVLIYKASGVFNFAQGAMVFFAALTFVGLHGASGCRSWLALPATLAVMIVLGARSPSASCCARWSTSRRSRCSWRRSASRSSSKAWRRWCGAPTCAGSTSASQDEPIAVAHRTATASTCRKFDLVAAGVAAVLVAVLALFFSRTRIGRALRAVADDHQAALAVGIPLQQIWAIVWAVAGVVALVAGLLWGARNGVQFALTFVALKALPVLILGGFDSVPGAIVGGLIIGASEKLAEVYLGPVRRRRHRGLVPVRARAAVPAGPARRAVRREDHPTRSDRAHSRHVLPRSRPVQDLLRGGRSDLSDPPGPDRASR